MKKSGRKSSASTRAGVKKTAIKDLATGQKADGVVGGKKDFPLKTHDCAK